ncbi:hypothetical protein BGZ60DRAFT_566344 [Tricladium varicosporioides]|nr:hypothetical protein BGZ60DRAFT_566344 [Hymenoscyphus varicosporioides]
MILRVLICLLATGPWDVLGQSPSPTPSSSATPTISVMVGATGHHFTPENVTANIGDIVEFRFYPLNHSVARAEFMDPCIPSEYHEGRTGFWSGFHPLQVIPSNPPTFQIKINDTKPMFFYCSAPGACMDGMVGVINQNSTQNLTVQKQYAAAAKIDLSPGEPIPAETRKITSSSSASVPTSTSTSTSASTTPTAPSSVATPSPSLNSLSTGAIAGIVIGSAFAVFCACALVYLCGRQKTLGEIIQRQQNHTSMTSPYYPGQGPMGMMSPGYPPKNYVDSDPRYSNQPTSYQQSEAGAESFRSRSPPMDENRESVIAPMNLTNGRETTRRPLPISPTSARNGLPSVATPVNPHQDEGAQSSNPSRVGRVKTQSGPHELSVESNKGYIPYTPEE